MVKDSVCWVKSYLLQKLFYFDAIPYIYIAYN